MSQLCFSFPIAPPIVYIFNSFKQGLTATVNSLYSAFIQQFNKFCFHLFNKFFIGFNALRNYA